MVKRDLLLPVEEWWIRDHKKDDIGETTLLHLNKIEEWKNHQLTTLQQCSSKIRYDSSIQLGVKQTSHDLATLLFAS